MSLLLNLVHPRQPHQSWHDKPPFIEHLYMYGEILTHFSVNTQTAWYSSYSQIGSKSRRIPGSESCGIRISWAAIGTLSLSLFLLFLLVTLLIILLLFILLLIEAHPCLLPALLFEREDYFPISGHTETTSAWQSWQPPYLNCTRSLHYLDWKIKHSGVDGSM